VGALLPVNSVDPQNQEQHRFFLCSSRDILNYEELIVLVRTSAQSYALQQHLKIHNIENVFSRSQFTVTFSLPAALLKHSRVYTGEKLYGCFMCNKSFAWKRDNCQICKNMSFSKLAESYLCSKTFDSRNKT
jgi:siroheme synthase (precorrin-2 oxidase/ferrochelatase)